MAEAAVAVAEREVVVAVAEEEASPDQHMPVAGTPTLVPEKTAAAAGQEVAAARQGNLWMLVATVATAATAATAVTMTVASLGGGARETEEDAGAGRAAAMSGGDGEGAAEDAVGKSWQYCCLAVVVSWEAAEAAAAAAAAVAATAAAAAAGAAAEAGMRAAAAAPLPLAGGRH